MEHLQMVSMCVLSHRPRCITARLEVMLLPGPHTSPHSMFPVVQKPTILALNAALLGCILSLLALLILSVGGAPALVPHVAFLLFLAVGLLFLINW